MGSSYSTTRPPWAGLSRPARVSVIGMDDTGKTSLLLKIAPHGAAHPDLVTSSPLPGLLYRTLRRGQLTMTSMDVGGCDKMAPRRKEMIRASSDGIIFVVDCSQVEVWVEAQEILKEFVLGLDGVKHSPLLVLANRWDAKDAISSEKVRQAVQRMVDQCHGHGPVRTAEVNAATGEGWMEGLTWLTDAIKTERARVPKSSEK